MTEMQFDPLGMKVDELREFRKLTGKSVFAVLESLKDSSGFGDLTEDEMVGLCYLIKCQGPEPFFLEDAGKLTLREIMDITEAFSDALENPTPGTSS